MVGYAFMGGAHSQAWRTAGRFFDLPLQPDLAVLAGATQRGRDGGGGEARLAAVETDWRALLSRDDIQLIDVCTPGDTHAEIAIAALDAGKHVLCEKPLAQHRRRGASDGRGRRAGAARGVR